MKAQNTTATKLARLQGVLSDKKSVLIVLQDNPDPDAIAAGAALKLLARAQCDSSCSLACGGSLGRAENRALAKYLAINLRSISELNPHSFDAVALVDTQPQTGNNSLPDGTPVDIIIDHHPLRRASRGAAFRDIRRNYGATSTILFEYLRQAKVEIDIPLATALLYGIRSDTQDLGREASKADIQAHSALYQSANSRMLGQITHADLPDDYFRLLHAGLEHARRYGRGIVTSLGEVESPDMVAEVADLLLRDEKAFFSLAWGSRQGTLYLSLRTYDPQVDAGKALHHIVGRRGTAGGHITMAGGQISLAAEKTAAQIRRLERSLIKRFLATIGETETRAVPLIPSP